MALFKKKKHILEEPPGFPELKKEVKIIEEPEMESKTFKEIDMPELPEIEEQEEYQEPEEDEEESEELEDEEQKELTEIPGLDVEEPKLEKKKKSAIPELKKELPKKISVDLKDAHENPAKIYKRHKEDKQNSFIEKEHKQKTQNNEEGEKSIFVKIEDFNNVTFSLSEIRNKLKLIESDISELKSLKSKEDSEIMSWEQEIISIKEKLLNITKILSNKGN